MQYFRAVPEWWEEEPESDPEDFRSEPTDEEAREMAAEDFHRMGPRARAKARRMAKRSTDRRRKNKEWARRQRREDVNAQVIF